MFPGCGANKASHIDLDPFLTLTIFLCLLLLSLKYGWRVSRIVGWQRYHGYFEIDNNNNKSKKA